MGPSARGGGGGILGIRETSLALGAGGELLGRVELARGRESVRDSDEGSLDIFRPS